MHLVNTEELIRACKEEDRKAQQLLFKKLSVPMMGVALRYMKNPEDAEEVLLTGLYKVFKNLRTFTYENERAFFGWVKRIVINEALMRLRKDKEIRFVTIHEEMGVATDSSPIANLTAGDLLKIIQSIPVGYRTVFNLFEVEGFSHREIGEALNISESTSKSQLHKARKLLKELVRSEKNKYGT